MGIEALLSTQIIDTTTVGRSVMTAVDAAAARTALGLGTLATQDGTITDYLTTAAAAATYQPLDADLTALAALTGTDNLYYRSGAATWSSVTIGTGLTFTGGTLAASGGSGIGGSTGSIDNLILRADGTGGATLQNSNWSVPDVYTASPNATVNHLSLQATGSTTNVSVSIVPKGTGAFSLAVPDGTTTGGNVRGANAIDLQTSRTNANQVASGANSVAIGINNRASADGSVAIGSGSTVTASINSVAIGASSATGTGQGRCVAIGNATASGEYAIAIGACTASGAGSIVISNEGGSASASGALAIGPALTSASGICSMAIGGTATTSRANEIAFGFRHIAFDVRTGGFFLSATTTNATATALQARNVFGSSNFTTRANTVLHGTLHVTGIKSDGSAVAVYTRRIILKNVGGTITLVENQTIGTDYEDNANTDLTVSNASPFFQVTGILSETWRWSGWFTPTCEMAYGT